jgi:flagellar motor switch protein FliG
MDPKRLPGSLKAAILVHAGGKRVEQKLFPLLEEEERQLLQELLSQMEEVSPDLLENVAKEFVQLCEGGGAPLQIENPEMEEESDPPPPPKPKRPPRKPADLSALKALEADHLYELIRDEHPQTIAMILVNVSPEVASEILAELPDETRGEVGFRIATLDKLGSSMVDEVAKVFDEALYESDDSVNVVKGGVDLMANILNDLDGFSGEVILEKIDENNAELAAAIKQKMFTFDDIVLVDNMGLQKVLRRVESQELAKALKAASSDVKEKIFTNMSERAGEMLKEEIEVLGAVRMKDVEDAQNIITRAVQEMEEQGELVIAGRRGEELIV